MRQWVLIDDEVEARAVRERTRASLVASVIGAPERAQRVIVASVHHRTRWIVLSERSVSRSFDSPFAAIRWANDALLCDYRIEQIGDD